MTQTELLTKLKTFIGQSVEAEDPTALDQCMDWAFKVCDILGIDRSTIRHQYAYQVWENPQDNTVTYFEFIPNTPNGTPQAGDFVIFNQNVSGVTGIAGHICIATGEGDSSNFHSLDQNWNGIQHVTEQIHSYTGVLGWLRPRMFEVNAAALTQCNSDRDINWNCFVEVSKALGIDADSNDKLGTVLKDKDAITALQNQVSDLTAQLTAATNELTTLQLQFDEYKKAHPDNVVSYQPDSSTTQTPVSNQGSTMTTGSVNQSYASTATPSPSEQNPDTSTQSDTSNIPLDANTNNLGDSSSAITRFINWLLAYFR